MQNALTSVANRPTPSTQETKGEINYSVDLLRRDEQERSHITKELSRVKEQYGIQGRAVLEVGCGLAQNLEIFRTDNTVLGVEGLATAVKEGQARGLDIVQGDLETPLNFETGSVDWVLCLDVLEHLVNPLGLMTEIHRILRPRGKVIVNVPNHFDLSGRVKLLFGCDLDVHNYFPENHDWDNPHLRFFTHSGIQQMLTTSGFAIVEDRSEHFPSFPKLPWLQRIKLGRVARFFARRRPSIFTGGFFLIGEKS
jgi:SAM-dependent methyltransferase